MPNDREPGMYGVREGFELLQGWLDIARFPFDDLRKTADQFLYVVKSGPLSCPAHQFGADGDARHGTGPS